MRKVIELKWVKAETGVGERERERERARQLLLLSTKQIFSPFAACLDADHQFPCSYFLPRLENKLCSVSCPFVALKFSSVDLH